MGFVVKKTPRRGQKRLGQDLKPATEAKKKAKKKAEVKAKAKPEPKPKAKYLKKIHKRNVGSGEAAQTLVVAAIYDNMNQKQIGQLTSHVTPDYDNVIKNFVTLLNEGKKSPEAVLAELNELKGSV